MIMKQVILCCLFGFAISAKLDNMYLPPSNARTAGGSHFLQTPYQGNNFGSSSGLGGFPGSSGAGRISQQHPNYKSNYQNHGFSSPSGFNYHNQGQGNTGLNKAHTGFKPSVYQHNTDSILRYNNQNNGDRKYLFDFETANKISQKEAGHVQYAGAPSESSVFRGNYSYVAPNRQKISVNYVADENGFRASSDQIAPGVTSNFGAQFQPSSLQTPQYGGKNRGSSGYPDHQGFSKYSGYSNNQITPFAKHGAPNQFGGGNNFQSVGGPNGVRPGGSHGFSPSSQGTFQLDRSGGFNQRFGNLHVNPEGNRKYLPPAHSVHGGY